MDSDNGTFTIFSFSSSRSINGYLRGIEVDIVFEKPSEALWLLMAVYSPGS